MLNTLPKTLVYQLKRLFGMPADFYHIVSITDDTLTGKSTTEKVKYHIKRVVCLPMQTLREMSIPGAYQKDTAYPSQNFKLEDRAIIIAKRDLPTGLKLHEKDYIITHYKKRPSSPGKRYNIHSMLEFDDDRALLIMGVFFEGGQLSEIYDLKVKEKLDLVESLV